MPSRCPARQIGLHESRLIYDIVMTDAYAMGYEALQLRDTPIVIATGNRVNRGGHGSVLPWLRVALGARKSSP